MNDSISVVTAMTSAMERVRRMLFAPFEIRKWFVVGFCAWLALLGHTRGSYGVTRWFGGGRPSPSPQSVAREARDYVAANLDWLLPLAVGIGVVLLTIWLVLSWISSRGHFMFLHCVATGRAEVVVPWSQCARQGNSLWLFRFAFGLLGAAICLPLAAAASWFGLLLLSEESTVGSGLLVVIGATLGLVVAGVIGGVIRFILFDQIVPTMMLGGSGCLEAWGRWFRLLSAGNRVRFLCYLLFRAMLALAIGVALFALVLATCCVAGCLMAVPYLGTVFLLPVLVFKRAYGPCYLAQFGPEWDVYNPAGLADSGR